MRRRQFISGTVATTLLPTYGSSEETGMIMRLRCRFADQDFTYLLQDNATVRDLASLLPLDLTIEDFSTNEKLVHLPRRLDETGRQPIIDEAPGDLCYFRGWGNLAFYHSGYTYRDDLILLGKIEGGLAPLRVKGSYPLRLDLLT